MVVNDKEQYIIYQQFTTFVQPLGQMDGVAW